MDRDNFAASRILEGTIHCSPGVCLSFCACANYTAIGASRPEEIQPALAMLWRHIKDTQIHHGTIVLAQGVDFPKHLERQLGLGTITVLPSEGDDFRQSIRGHVEAVLARRDTFDMPREPAPEIRIKAANRLFC